MSIGSFISQQKAKFREIKYRKSMDDNEQMAEEIKRLKLERTRLEGKAKLREIQEKEKARIGKAKATLKETGTPAKLRNFVGNLQKKVNENKPNLRGIDFGGQKKIEDVDKPKKAGSPNFVGGGGSLDFTK